MKTFSRDTRVWVLVFVFWPCLAVLRSHFWRSSGTVWNPGTQTQSTTCKASTLSAVQSLRLWTWVFICCICLYSARPHDLHSLESWVFCFTMWVLYKHLASMSEGMNNSRFLPKVGVWWQKMFCQLCTNVLCCSELPRLGWTGLCYCTFWR